MIPALELPYDGTIFGPTQPCFGCSPNHPAGFRLRFETVGEFVETKFTPGENHQGPLRLMHGGLISTLADETAAWTVLIATGKFGFTTSFEAKFHKGVRVGEVAVSRGRVTKPGHRLCRIAVEILQAEQLCFSGDFTFAILDKMAAEKLMQGPIPEEWNRFCR
jgi:acyl-coenzyme A thioesterase PaaI-like protein